MATVLDMPKLSDTMDSGTLVAWKKKEGEAIEPGEVIAEVESDKATMELEAFERGFLRKILVKAGESALVGQPIAIVSASADENIEGLTAEAVTPKPEAPPEGGTPKPDFELRTSNFELRTNPKLAVSPLAARMAQDAGLDLTRITGSGPGGRIIKRDIEQALAESGGARPVGMIPAVPRPGMEHPELEYEDIPNSQMRKIIAERLSASNSQIPHYYVTMEIDMEQAIRLREQLNAVEGVKISLNDFVIKAAAMALEKHPLVNASFTGASIRVYHRIDIGMAVAMADGLITPVIREANKKGLLAISQAARELAERARAKKLRPEEFSGSTFTVSNLGMLGVKHFTAVINPPEAAILAIGAARQVAVVEKGQLSVGQRMEVTMSSDHRVIDGAQSARFLKDFKYFLENPITFAL